MRLTWKREPREKGLAGVCQGERGYHLRLKGEKVATVSPILGVGRVTRGYYWCARHDALGVPLRNTAAERKHYRTVDEAKAECLEYVKGCLKKAKEKP